MRRSVLLLPLAFVVALLAGCGNKGPLVLPPTRPAPAASAPVPVAPAAASTRTTPATGRP
ncbi:MAG: sugar transporter [Rhodanobacter sp.]|nr:MAG: sugar transporter [Rhodanobacter sp.]TAM00655.1 MAG: sugar transporter [Rhodanobacter sp.]TAM40634.1 MAG: sugar transporter [Rhodanobacter sp.]TAN25551.1 MAG: sugar transporter [Rhodanobacter sp.]